MNNDENSKFTDIPLASGRANHQNWAVCSVCHGGGKRTRKPSARVRRRYQRALRDATTAEEQPKPLVPHVDDCPHCRGSGLIESTAKPLPNMNYPSVAIIGGGLGGLALAVACRQRGIPCTIYERDENFDQRSQGYGLTMQQASKALECFGIYSLQGGITSTKHVVHSSDGKVVGEWGLRKWGRSSAKSAPRRRNVHIPRQALRKVLLQALGGDDEVQWNHRLMHYVEGEEQVDLSFQVGDEGVKAQADIVVGADGIRSAVRKQLIGDAVSPLRYLDCIVILGICPLENIDESVLLDGKTVFQTSNGNERMYMMPFSAMTIMWQLSFPLPEEEAIAFNRLGPQALKDEALRRCPAWHAPVAQILAETPVSEITGYPVYDRELLTTAWLPTESRVTLLGDAAHPMSPFKGQGANQALLDALSLARCLYKKGRPAGRVGVSKSECIVPVSTGSITPWVQESLREFEAEMMPRSEIKVKASAEAARFLHTEVAIFEGNLSRGDAARKMGEV